MSTKAIAAVASLAMAIGVYTGTVIDSATRSTGTPDVSTAIIRLGDSVYVHEDAAHTSVGIHGWYVNSKGNLVVVNALEADPTEEYVAVCQVTPDETLAKLGVDVGCSGGRLTSQIWLYKDGKRLRPDDPIFGSGKANIWYRSERFIPGGES